MTDGEGPANPRTGILQWLLAIWMIAVLIFYWIMQGSPGIPAIADITAPLRNIIQQFFSAPYLG